MFISKGSYRYGQSKNAFLKAVQKPHLPVRDCKLPHLMCANIGPRTEICGNPGLPFSMVTCFNQCNFYIKRNLQVWRVQKCIPLVGAKIALTCAVRQTTPSHVGQYWAKNGNLRKSESTFRHGTVFAQSNVYIKKKLQVWRVQKYIPLIGAQTALTCVGRNTSPPHVSQYTA